MPVLTTSEDSGQAHAVEAAALHGKRAVAQQGIGFIGHQIAAGYVVNRIADDHIIQHRRAGEHHALAGRGVDDIELVVNQRVEIALVIGERTHGAAQREGVDLRARAVGIAAHQRGGAVIYAQEIQKVARGHQVGNRAGAFHPHIRAAGAGNADKHLVRTFVGHHVQIGVCARRKVAPHGAFLAAGNAQRVRDALGPRRGAQAKRENQNQRYPLTHVLSSCVSGRAAGPARHVIYIRLYYTIEAPSNCDGGVTMPC